MFFPKYNYDVQVKKDEMSRARSTHDEEQECLQGFDEKSIRKETSRKTYKKVRG
jgi:hypothetical protein